MSPKTFKPLARNSRILWKLSCNFCDELKEVTKQMNCASHVLTWLFLITNSFSPGRSSCQLNFKGFSEVWNSQNSSLLQSPSLFNNLINHSTSTKMASQSKCTRSETQGTRKVNASWCLLLFHAKSMLPVALIIITHKNHNPIDFGKVFRYDSNPCKWYPNLCNVSNIWLNLIT